MTDLAIRVENLSQLYRIGPRGRYKALRDALTDAMSAPFRRLKQISNYEFGNSNFAIRNPHFIWPLKEVLSGTTRPTEGCVKIGGHKA